MKKSIFLLAVGVIAMSSCVSQKKYAALEAEKQQAETDLSAAKLELASCIDKQKSKSDEVDYLKKRELPTLEQCEQFVYTFQTGSGESGKVIGESE